MNDLKLEDHYKVDLNAVKNLYRYSSCRTENIPLFGHQVLPQKYYYGYPKISPDGKYISIIAKGNENDKAFLWTFENLDSYLFSYTSKEIDNFIFSPDSKNFYILYKFEPPVKYDIKTGKEIISFDFPEEKVEKLICYSFSPDGKILSIGTKTQFIAWDTNNGKVLNFKNEESSVKTIINDWQLSIRDSLEVILFNKFNTPIHRFNLPNIRISQEILSCIISPEKKYLFYANKNYIYRYKLQQNTKNVRSEIVIQFEDAEKVIIDDECISAITTDMKNIIFWNLKEKNNNYVLLKEKFESININFKNNLVATVDSLCINITDSLDEDNELPEKFIWLNENPKKFLYFTFSPDFKVLLATLDENNAISYNIETGRVIKKWRNMEDDWSMACEMAPDTSSIAVIATKSDSKTIKIWNYNNGNEVLTLKDFNVHSFDFSENGQLLACGVRKGKEIARIWDLTDSSFISYYFDGSNNNLYTIVNLTDSLDSNDNKRLILASIGQKPVVFDVITRKLLYECQCPVNFEKIQKIKSNVKYNCFLVRGRDKNKKNMALLYRLSDGKLLQIYDNCNNIDLAKYENIIISKSSNLNGGNLTISNIQNLDKITHNNCQLSAPTSCFLQDNKSIVSVFGEEKNLKFIISEVKSGKMIAEINYTQNYDRHAEVDLGVNKEENILVLRYIEFIEPLEM